MADSVLYGILHCLFLGSKNGNSKVPRSSRFWYSRKPSPSHLHFHLLAVLGEEDKYRTAKWRKFHLGSHYLIQAIYAHVHSYVSLADIVLGTLIQSKHTASSFS